MKFEIGNREVGSGCPVFIIAEMSANHAQDFEIAARTIQAMKDAGADAVKLQTYTPETMTIDCDNEYFRIKGTIWNGQNLYQLYQTAYTPWEWQPKLKKIAEDLGLIFFSTPFDKSAADFLEKMDVPAYKIASFEITDSDFIEYVAAKGKPVIISTGIGTLPEIEDAVSGCRNVGNQSIALLKCTSAYPAPIEEANLKTIPDMAERFNVVAGLSDHTLGSVVSIAAVAIGAKIIEKHFILDKKLGGPDAEFSMEPGDFKAMCNSIRSVESSLGRVVYELTEDAIKGRRFARSLFAVRDIEKGETINNENVKSIRPSDGMPPRKLRDILGRKTTRFIKKGTPLCEDMISEK